MNYDDTVKQIALHVKIALEGYDFDHISGCLMQAYGPGVIKWKIHSWQSLADYIVDGIPGLPNDPTLAQVGRHVERVIKNVHKYWQNNSQ